MWTRGRRSAAPVPNGAVRDRFDEILDMLTHPYEWTPGSISSEVCHKKTGMVVYWEGVQVGNNKLYVPRDRQAAISLAVAEVRRKLAEVALDESISVGLVDWGETAKVLARMVLDGREDAVRPLLDDLLGRVNG